MSSNTVEIIDRGLRCLSDNLGASETELFIVTILKERFDYTEWRKNFVDRINTFDELDQFVDSSRDVVQFNGKNAKII
ncbi:MAG: hypothetical protein Q4E57_11030 [Eubacteriales bacterium]|nr:hypothetical protein [Eubacteriales bacterium]